MKNNPLVTVGIPVRNGANGIREALDSILKQTYQNIEIVISENNSIDDTYNICLEYQKISGNIIKIYKQEDSLTAIENFRFTLDKAKGDFFMWVSHDDTREESYIEMLLKPFLENSGNFILTFGDLYITDGSKIRHKEFNFENTDLSILQKFKKTSELQGYHMYGLWKTNELKKIPFINNPYYPDMPILMCASCLGEFKYVKNANFFYREVIKTKEQRAQYQDNLSKLPRFLFLKFIIINFKAVSKISNNFYAFLSTSLIFWKYFKLIPKYIINRLKK